MTCDLKWEPGCLKVTQTGPQWGPKSLWCFIWKGMEAVCGLLEKITGTLSCFFYYDIFLYKPTFSSQFILHEHCHIQADFEEVYLKWWAWLCCKASGPEPSSPSHLSLAPQHESGLTGTLKWWLHPSHSSSHQSHVACLVLHLSPPWPDFNTAAMYAVWIQECLAAWPCWRDGMAWDGRGWKAGYPGSKGLLILDRRFLIYTIGDKASSILFWLIAVEMVRSYHCSSQKTLN